MNIEECSLLPSGAEDSDELRIIYKSCPITSTNQPLQVSFVPYKMANTVEDYGDQIFSSALRSRLNRSGWQPDPSWRHFRSGFFNMSLLLWNNRSQSVAREKRSSRDGAGRIRFVLEELKVKCIFRICKNPYWCEWPMPCIHNDSSLVPTSWIESVPADSDDVESLEPKNNKFLMRIAAITIARPARPEEIIDQNPHAQSK
ncbi:hypothetical protein Ciccas_005103 [Cichlidogyrus casuarinus]|uniref:Uncharacterized protein n=1 Tax=Cichlidogyrus casuarinus TaxID=1844966 RepID=A0ABD2QAI5_9PLAT